MDLMDVIAQVLEEIDANPAQDQAVFNYPLRNANAQNVETIVNNLFGTGSGTRSTTSGSRTGTTGTTGSRTGTTGSAFSSNLNLSQIGSGTGSTTSRNTGTTTRTGGTARVSGNASQTAADLAGQVYAVADADTNSLLVMTATGNFERVKQVLAELDRPIPQVLIKVLIAEVTHDDDTDLGVEFSAINLPTSGKSTVFTDFGVAAASGGTGVQTRRGRCDRCAPGLGKGGQTGCAVTTLCADQ
ncbi:MAG: hypothetical protein HC898_04175 [Phycisphaerales bacterium]|nr:hypothetical protein [Phycisphaerales bacterium]